MSPTRADFYSANTGAGVGPVKSERTVDQAENHEDGSKNEGSH